MDSGTKVAVIFCVYNRPQKLLSYLKNITQTAGYPHKIYCITEDIDEESTRIAKESGLCEVCVNTGHTVVSAQNFGYTKTTEPFIALLSDDLLIPPNWLKRVMDEFDKHPEAMMIGTDDGYTHGNSAYFIRREYIEKDSCVVDVPNTLYHPGYKHTFSDTEMFWTAMNRGVFYHTPDVVIFHDHYSLSNVNKRDGVAERAERWSKEDGELYLSRRGMFRGV
jgi:glycosyltransferase involved in cell wall biosynthesis